MEAGDDPTATPINFPRDAIKDHEWKVDPATYVAARIFNAVAAPPGMPDYMQIEADARAEQAKASAQEAGFVAADTGGFADGKTAWQRQQDKEEETRLTFASLWEALEEQRRREREWDQSRITIGTVAMSGEEWDEALDQLSDPRIRDQLIQTMSRKKGWTQDRAQKAADDALTLAQIAQKEKSGTITAADRTQADDISRRNPDAAVMVKEAANEYQQWGVNTTIDPSVAGQSGLSGDIASAAKSRQDAVQSMADKAFPSAPSLASHFDAACNDSLFAKADEPSVKPLPPRPSVQIDLNGPF